MTQQKPLPIATGITGGCNIPSSFILKCCPGIRSWRMLLGRGRRQLKGRRWGGDCRVGEAWSKEVCKLWRRRHSQETRTQGGRG